jgi:UDP:flavonoid glycosyltransferase YjiC (YdhE family)
LFTDGEPLLNVLVIPVGSHGDVHPMVGVGEAMAKRGHRVTVLTNDHFGPMVRRAGLEFESLATEEEFRAVAEDPTLWHPTRGWKTVFSKGIVPLIRRTYDAVVRHYRAAPDDTVVVAATMALGARVAQDELGIRTASVHLQPSIFLSGFETPRLPGMFVPPGLLPVAFKQWFFRQFSLRVVDPVLTPTLNGLRAERGLPPVADIMNRYWHSPDLVLGLFPEWYARPQPDWPPNVHLTGFPLFDEKGHASLPEKLTTFLAEGKPPVAFTFGSAMLHGHRFFEQSVAACARAGVRGVLLTRHGQQVPASLPEGVIHVDYAPFSELLPRCAAIVHHGGIGTTAQAMACACPQLIMPMSHDQPDNAERVGRLGVGATLSVRRYRARAIAELLRQLTTSSPLRQRCADVAARIRGTRPMERTCELIEGLPRPSRTVPRSSG